MRGGGGGGGGGAGVGSRGYSPPEKIKLAFLIKQNGL